MILSSDFVCPIVGSSSSELGSIASAFLDEHLSQVNDPYLRAIIDFVKTTDVKEVVKKILDNSGEK